MGAAYEDDEDDEDDEVNEVNEEDEEDAANVAAATAADGVTKTFTTVHPVVDLLVCDPSLVDCVKHREEPDPIARVRHARHAVELMVLRDESRN